MSDDPFRVYIKSLEARLARQHAQIQAWPSQIEALKREAGRWEQAHYARYVENEDLKKEIVALKAVIAKRKSPWKPKVIKGPWKKKKGKTK